MKSGALSSTAISAAQLMVNPD